MLLARRVEAGRDHRFSGIFEPAVPLYASAYCHFMGKGTVHFAVFLPFRSRERCDEVRAMHRTGRMNSYLLFQGRLFPVGLLRLIFQVRSVS